MNNCILNASAVIATTNKSRDMDLVWKVVNREDYHPPSLYHPHGVGFQEDNESVVIAEGLNDIHFVNCGQYVVLHMYLGHIVANFVCETLFILVTSEYHQSGWQKII